MKDEHSQFLTLFGNACSDMGCWQDFEWVTLAMMPMFLFSTTFFPLGVYPRGLQLFVECTPLYQGIEIVRGLMLTVVSRRLGRLLLS